MEAGAMTRILTIIVLIPLLALAGLEIVVYTANHVVAHYKGKTITFELADPLNLN